MRIEKINFNKIKVTFSPEDLIEHNITPEAVRTNAPNIHSLLMNIVKRAHEEMGFSAENARLMVEAMPGEADSMVMYITKLESDEDLKDVICDVKKKIRLKVKKSEPSLPARLCVSFEDFEDALKLACFAHDVNEGELYFFEGRYHLIVSCEAANRFSEFGSSTTNDQICDLIMEHGRKICDNALKTLRDNF